jgi:hypothetical protein
LQIEQINLLQGQGESFKVSGISKQHYIFKSASMKKISVFVILLLIGGCTAEQVEEIAFRKVMEYQLIDECGEDDEECIKAVEEQIEFCMEKSDWRKYVNSDDDDDEMKRFINEFFPCFKDPNGNSYFK